MPYPATRCRRAGRGVFAVFAWLFFFNDRATTEIYTQTNAILAQLTDIQSRNVRDKSERLFRFFVKNYRELFAPDTEGNDALVFEPYLRSYEDLLALNDNIATYVPLSSDLTSRATSVPLLSPLLRGIRSLVRLDGAAQP